MDHCINHDDDDDDPQDEEKDKEEEEEEAEDKHELTIEDDGQQQEQHHHQPEEAEEDEGIKYKHFLYTDPDCSNNVARCLRVVRMSDIQTVPGRDGYTYFFNSVAEGPMMTAMTLKQILVLLHVIHSFIPEECILETEFLKPTFNKQGGLEKLVEQIPMAEEEWQSRVESFQSVVDLPIYDVPMDFTFSIQDAAENEKKMHTRPVDVAEILLVPVRVTYTTESLKEGETKMVCFWQVILKTRKCYNFNLHLKWLINDLDSEDKSHLKKFVNKVNSLLSYSQEATH